MEANFSCTSFLTLDKLRKLRYGSQLVNVVADARPEHGPGLGSFAFDDEGVAAQSTPIISNGLFTGYLSSTETAHAICSNRSGGTLRATGWNRLPIIRMTNVSFLPGENPLLRESLFAALAARVFMETSLAWSMCAEGYAVRLRWELVWEVFSGRLTRMLKDP